MNYPKKNITVLGAGSWGTALAILLARNGHPVLLWGKDTLALQKMQENRCNEDYLPQVSFPDNLKISLNLEESVENTRELLMVVPSNAFQEILFNIKPYFNKKACIVWGTKGLDPENGAFLHQVVAKVLGQTVAVGVLSGPSFAHEVATKQPTAVALASTSHSLLQNWVNYLHGPTFRVYPTKDVVGVQIAGVVKNILAIAAGIAEGLGFGANTKAALTTRGLAEMTRLGLHLGGIEATFLGLAGVGDLVLTCYSDASRNRRLGLAIGRGASIRDAKKLVGPVIEGAQNAAAIHKMAHKNKIEMPICEQVYQVLQEQVSPIKAVETLLARAPSWTT